MNWIRDNILKILIILGVAVVIIVIFALVTKPKGDVVVKGTKYGELETKLQNAAIKYIGKHKKLLPTTKDDVTRVKLNTLISNNYIGKLVAVDNANTKCDGYVEISKISDDKEDYRYTPYIKCGEYYTTKTIGDYIIDKETNDGTFNRTTDAGLYQMGEKYIFKGESVNNFIKIGDHKYRIIGIESDKTLKLISTTLTNSSYVWDDRYNVDKKENYGINNFQKSRLYDSLLALYENTDINKGEIYFSSDEKEYIIEHDFCIGRRSIADGNIYSGVECTETIPLKVGLLTVDEVSKASIDPNCNSIYSEACFNYNYFYPAGRKKSYTTITPVADNSYQFYKIRYDGALNLTASVSSQLYPVVYINSKTIFSSGTGTTDDPYIVR